MASQKQRTIVFGLLVAVCLIFLAALSSRPTLFGFSKAAHELLDRRTAEDQRLQDMAIRDLRETQDEIAKMKAFGIGMPAEAGQSGQAQR
jgi:hypothetical protein